MKEVYNGEYTDMLQVLVDVGVYWIRLPRDERIALEDEDVGRKEIFEETICVSSWQHSQGPFMAFAPCSLFPAQHWNAIQIRTVENIHWSLPKEYPKERFSLLLGEQNINNNI